jgi:hypothetical protein
MHRLLKSLYIRCVLANRLLDEIPNTSHSCCWHGLVAARVDSERPDNISKIFPLLGVNADS